MWPFQSYFIFDDSLDGPHHPGEMVKCWWESGRHFYQSRHTRWTSCAQDKTFDITAHLTPAPPWSQPPSPAPASAPPPPLPPPHKIVTLMTVMLDGVTNLFERTPYPHCQIFIILQCYILEFLCHFSGEVNRYPPDCSSLWHVSWGIMWAKKDR